MKGELGGRLGHPAPFALPYRAGNKSVVDAEFGAVLWDFVAEGILVPGRANLIQQPNGEQQKAWPWFTITPYGFDALRGEGDTTSPHDAERYLSAARERLPEGDELIPIYLAEATKAFTARLYPSSVVMLGISAEGLMEWLIKAVRRHLSQQPNATSRFDKALSKVAYRTGERFEKLLTEMKRHRVELPRDLFELIDSHLSNALLLLKSYRDDVAHLRPFRVDAQLADAQLRLYLPTLSVAAELNTALSSPCSLDDA